MLIRIKGGRIIDPGNPERVGDIRIADGKIVEITDMTAGDDHAENEEVVDASGKIVVPGLIDMHVHFREPGEEYKETIETGCRAAAWGGFTAVCTMPNTKPVNDKREITEYIIGRAALTDLVRVHPVAAISAGLEGKALCEYSELKDGGAVAVSDDGNPVTNSQLMRRALEYAKGFDLPIISHCEDLDLTAHGAMNEGAVSTRLGLPGIPNAAESVMVQRDIALCELTGAHVHIAHVSTAESVRAVRAAKKRGIPVTAETAPHYFTLTEEAVEGYDTKAKMNPPLRSQHDREAVREGLADGTIDVIATDHAPHSTLEKDVEFDRAANGIIGLETSLSLSLMLVWEGCLTMEGLIEKMSANPARILGLRSGLKNGNPADITIIDPDAIHTVDSKRFQSMGRNTPFNGWEFKGRPFMTIVGGKTKCEMDNL